MATTAPTAAPAASGGGTPHAPDVSLRRLAASSTPCVVEQLKALILRGKAAEASEEWPAAAVAYSAAATLLPDDPRLAAKLTKVRRLAAAGACGSSGTNATPKQQHIHPEEDGENCCTPTNTRGGRGGRYGTGGAASECDDDEEDLAELLFRSVHGKAALRTPYVGAIRRPRFDGTPASAAAPATATAATTPAATVTGMAAAMAAPTTGRRAPPPPPCTPALPAAVRVPVSVGRVLVDCCQAVMSGAAERERERVRMSNPGSAGSANSGGYVSGGEDWQEEDSAAMDASPATVATGAALKEGVEEEQSYDQFGDGGGNDGCDGGDADGVTSELDAVAVQLNSMSLGCDSTAGASAAKSAVKSEWCLSSGWDACDDATASSTFPTTTGGRYSSIAYDGSGAAVSRLSVGAAAIKAEGGDGGSHDGSADGDGGAADAGMSGVEVIEELKLEIKGEVEKQVLEVVNGADEESVQTLWGVGPKRAKAILRVRRDRPFTSLGDLARIGLSRAQIIKVAQHHAASAMN